MPILKGRTSKPGEGYRGRRAREPRKYIDLNEYDTGMDAQASGPMIRVAEVYRYEDVRKLSDIVYNGDILLIDYSSIANDDLTLRRIISELKSIAKDVNGDVAGIGKNFLAVTPSGMRISRKKIRGLS
ncbi:MAG: cell division protein SepF [Euryarchaeota archaeon]|nr:cell division protein SepF [Euryarchaeota archaeon]